MCDFAGLVRGLRRKGGRSRAQGANATLMVGKDALDVNSFGRTGAV